jgi:Heparinase II/III-like protein
VNRMAVLVLVGFFVWSPDLCVAEEGALRSWPALLDASADDAAMAEARDQLVAQARKAVALPIIRRVYKLEEVGEHRTWLDGRSRALEDEIRETFALAMSDFAACNTTAAELPLLAAAYRLTGDAAFCGRVAAQLEEMTTWSPLQRPGWTLYTPGNRLPADGKDGNWLATGTGIRAIHQALELMPKDPLDSDLIARLHALLETEIASIVDDWKTERPWFVPNNPITNQWVLPTEGLVTACLVVGPEKHAEAYALGVKNMLRSIGAHGSGGEFEEGVGYASFTVTSILHTAHAMAVHGDRRAIDHPFLANFPTWLVHHLQPGNMTVNCFDAGSAYGAADKLRPLLSLLAVCTGSPAARWALANPVGGPTDDLAGLAARGMAPVGADAAPPLFAQYERATRVNWRDSWNDDGTGVWVRGGHPTDQHDHQDRGHVNFIVGGKPILIEAGTPSYHHKLMMTHYTTGAGHNILQVGTAFPEATAEAGKVVKLPGWQKPGGVAPITMKRLDAEGGEVAFDGSSCYDGVRQWNREVSWNAASLDVADTVSLSEGNTDIILFRWHLGTEDAVTIEGEEKAYTVTWSDAELTLEGSAPLTVTQTPMPDNTLDGHSGDEDPGNVHTCLVIQTAAPCTALTLKTRVTPK